MLTKKTRKTVPKSSGRKRAPSVKGEAVSAPDIRQGWERAVGSGDFFKFDETGKSCEGTVIDIEYTNAKGRYDILTLRDGDGNDIKLSFTKALSDKFEKHSVLAGWLVCITLLSIVKLTGGRTFKDMDVLYKPVKDKLNSHNIRRPVKKSAKKK